MQKNKLMGAHMEVRDSCRNLIRAVNDNPDAFQGITVSRINSTRNKVNNIGFISISLFCFMWIKTILISAFH